MPVFSIPLSGLTASSAALSTIANNLANLNTVGYKESRVMFRDLFYQTLGTSGSGNPIQQGAGAAVGSMATTFSPGSMDTTGVPTDVAITGDGFFVVQNTNGTTAYTRAGNFQVGPDGFLTTEDGQTVMGYPVTNGQVSLTGSLSALQLGKGQISPPAATTNIDAQMNLDATAKVGDGFGAQITIYDSLGASHVITLQFAKAAQNTWTYQVTLPAVDTGGTGNPTVLSTGTLTFDGNGHLTSPAGSVTGIAIAGLSSGASDMTFDWKLYDDSGSGLLTQMAAASNTASKSADGFASGTLQDFTIGSDGLIQGAFSNDKTMVLGQIALANFANPQGLTRTGKNCFASTLASGDSIIGTPGTGGRGTLAGGALELSNVDIAQEFAQMILAQRGFQANARAITTFDQITQDTINLKQ
jgi:flagellar hook protein FlgE